MRVGAMTKMVKICTVMWDCLICAFVFDDALLGRSQVTSTGGPKPLDSLKKQKTKLLMSIYEFLTKPLD